MSLSKQGNDNFLFEIKALQTISCQANENSFLLLEMKFTYE